MLAAAANFARTSPPAVRQGRTVRLRLLATEVRGCPEAMLIQRRSRCRCNSPAKGLTPRFSRPRAKRISSMGLVSFLCGRCRRTETADLVVQVSVLSRETVVGLTVARARRMTLAEARGYIRARARETVTRQAELLMRRHAELTAAQRDHVVSQAIDQVVYMVMRHLVHTAPAARRRAASGSAPTAADSAFLCLLPARFRAV